MDRIEKDFQEKILVRALMSASFWKKQHMMLSGNVDNLSRSNVLSNAHVNFVIGNEMRRINNTILRSKRI